MTQGLPLLLLAGFAGPGLAGDAVWQFAVDTGVKKHGKAFLWIPPECRYVRGLIVGQQVILEKPARCFGVIGLRAAPIGPPKHEPKTTADLTYDELEVINSFKGSVADVRLYDAVLPAEAIRKFAEK